MRKALASIAPLLARIEATDRRQIADQAKNDANQVRNEERFKLILDAMQDKKFPPQKVFYDGQIYDAFEQMKKFVRMARQELIVIDPYFADSVLPLMAQKRQGVQVLVVKNSRNKLLHAVDVAQFNAQYANSLTVKVSDKFHDRFLVIDKTVLIHVGASLNHLGKKCFAFSSMDKSNIPDIVAKRSSRRSIQTVRSRVSSPPARLSAFRSFEGSLLLMFYKTLFYFKCFIKRQVQFNVL